MLFTEYMGLHNQIQGLISSIMMTNDNIRLPAEKSPPKVHPWKDSPATREFEELAKNILKGELKRRGVTYAQLADKLAKIGVTETERNLNNKISRGGFSAAFLLQCMMAIEAKELRLL